MIYVRIHETDNGNILAMCDEETISRVLMGDKIELDMPKYANFYKGELVGEAEAKIAAKDIDFYSANVVGKRSIKIMIDIGAITEGDVRQIEDVPFVQIYKIT